jgi:hypothetical protein
MFFRTADCMDNAIEFNHLRGYHAIQLGFEFRQDERMPFLDSPNEMIEEAIV